MNVITEKTNDLQLSASVGGLSEKELVSLYQIGAIVKLATGDALIREGSQDRSSFLVLKGSLKVLKNLNGFTVEYATFHQGEWLVNFPPTEPNGRIASVAALEPSTVLAFDELSLNALDPATQLTIFKSLNSHSGRRFSNLMKLSATLTRRNHYMSSYIGTTLKGRDNDYTSSQMIQNILKSVPRLPMYVTRLTSMLLQENVSAREVVELAKEDPSLVSAVLKTVNSAYYNLRCKISDFQHAVLLLGFNQVYQLTIDDGIQKTMPDTTEFREMQSHAVVISHIALEITQLCKSEKPTVLGTIGLLHDIGKSVILLMKKQHPKLNILIDMLDQAKIGALLLREWNIPTPICDTIEYQGYAEFTSPWELPEELSKNVAVLHIAHLSYEYMLGKSYPELPGAFNDEYLQVLNPRLRSFSDLVNKYVLPSLHKKANIVPDGVRQFLAESKMILHQKAQKIGAASDTL